MKKGAAKSANPLALPFFRVLPSAGYLSNCRAEPCPSMPRLWSLLRTTEGVPVSSQTAWTSVVVVQVPCFMVFSISVSEIAVTLAQYK